VLVDFWATWCGPCRTQGPIVAQVARDLSATAVVGKVDVDQQRELAGRFGIVSIPTLLVFKNGKIARDFVGVSSAETLKRALTDAAF
jgi:thioredoxin 1